MVIVDLRVTLRCTTMDTVDLELMEWNTMKIHVTMQ